MRPGRASLKAHWPCSRSLGLPGDQHLAASSPARSCLRQLMQRTPSWLPPRQVKRHWPIAGRSPSLHLATSAISRPMTTQEDEAAESRRVRDRRNAAVSTDETQAEAARRSLQRATPRSGTAEARERASRVAPTGLVRTGEAPIAASFAPAIDGDAWADLFSTGAALVHKLVALLGGREGVSPATESGGAPLGPTAVAHDPQTGQPYLKIPLPPLETLQQVARLLSALVEGSRPR